jgi:hypothetical protein
MNAKLGRWFCKIVSQLNLAGDVAEHGGKLAYNRGELAQNVMKWSNQMADVAQWYSRSPDWDAIGSMRHHHVPWQTLSVLTGLPPEVAQYCAGPAEVFQNTFKNPNNEIDSY